MRYKLQQMIVLDNALIMQRFQAAIVLPYEENDVDRKRFR